MAERANGSDEALILGSVLVTGGCGMLGSHVTSLILSRFASPKNKVSVLDIREPLPSTKQAGVSYHAGDLTSSEAVRQVLDAEKPDVIIHTASPTFQDDSKKSRDLMYRVNVNGTRILLDEARRANVKAFVYTSSASVVMDAKSDIINGDESYPVHRGKDQPEYYSETKAHAEELVLAANTRPTHTPPASLEPSIPPFLTVALRPSFIYGERDVQALPPIISSMLDRRTGFQIGENTNLWDHTYAGNAAYAHLLAANRLLETWDRLEDDKSPTTPELEEETALMDPEDEFRVDGEAFFVTDGAPMRFFDFTRSVWFTYYQLSPSEANVPPPVPASKVWVLSGGLAFFLAAIVNFFARLFGLPEPSFRPQVVRFALMQRYFRIDKARRRLGYDPPWTPDEAMQRSCQWFVDKHSEQRLKKTQ